jgi:hypothetical protein
MKTSEQWWNSVRHDERKFATWLQKQYRGEMTAVSRLLGVLHNYSGHFTQKQERVIMEIVKQERDHASWVRGLLISRGLSCAFSPKEAESRYWQTQKIQNPSFSELMAIAAHAEGMRLERIQVIADDATAPSDVRDVFRRILRDETFHERAFRQIAGEDAMSRTRYTHEKGRRLLGLTV